MLQRIVSLGPLLVVLFLPILSDAGEQLAAGKHRSKPVTTESGLKFIDLIVGPGRKAELGDTALVVADHGVLRLQRRERGDVVGRQPLQKRECFPSRDDDPSHMADVEETGLSPNGLVLVHHAGILDRHFPAGKIDQLGTRRDMSFKNRGMFHGKATGSAVSG